MPVLQAVERALEGDERTAIPAVAMQHLEKLARDRVFVGSVVFAKAFIPTVFVKLSAKTAREIGLRRNAFLTPNYKFLTVETPDGDLVSLLSLMADGHPIVHLPLDPGHLAVRRFLSLVKSARCFCLDVTVDDPQEPFGTIEFLEVDGEQLDWVGRNLVRSATAPSGNDWKAALRAYQTSLGLLSRDISLTFDQPANLAVHARLSTEFITRGDDDYVPDLSIVEEAADRHRYDWLQEKHGIHLVDEPVLPATPEFYRSLGELRVKNLPPAKMAQALERLLKRYPKNPTVLYGLLVAYRNLGKEAEAEDLYGRLQAIAEDDAYVALLLLKDLPDDLLTAKLAADWPDDEFHQHLPAGQSAKVTSFLLFEELTIRSLAYLAELTAAMSRFTRLVEFGVSADLTEPLAATIARAAIKHHFKLKGKLPTAPPAVLRTTPSRMAQTQLLDAYRSHLSYLTGELNQRMNRAAPATRQGGGKIGRNAPCPCGSGRKYKQCCGR